MNRIFLVIAVFLLAVTAAFSFGGKEKDTSDVVQVTGLVRLVGSSPKYVIVITGSQKDWYIEKEEMDKLFELQQQTVTVEGEETAHELKFANGMSAGIRYTLRNIRIISIE